MSKLPKKDLHVLFVPAWLPTSSQPYVGNFILEQANALHNHTSARIGLIYRQDLTFAQNRKLRREHLKPFEHIIVTKPYIPKASRFTIDIWCRQYFDAYRKYAKRYGPPDVIHAHSYIAGFAASYIAKKTGIPFVLTEHASTFISEDIRPSQISSVKRALNSASSIICLSNSLKKVLEKFTDQHIEVIPELVDTKVFYPQDVRKNEIFTIVDIGYLIPRKGYDILIDAFKIAHNLDNAIRLEIVGDGKLRDELEARVQNANLQEDITFHGGLPADEIAKLLCQSHLCISTSHVETFGITLIEAMACGIPVVATPSGGPQDIVTSETGLLTADWNPDVIAKAILNMKQRQGSYEMEGIAQYTEDNYGSEAVAGQIHDVYRNVLLK